MLSLGRVVDRCEELWGAVILQIARDARQATLEIPQEPRPGERLIPFKVRRRKAEVDRYRGRHSLLWFKSPDFRFICGLCGADPDHVLDLLRQYEGLRV